MQDETYTQTNSCLRILYQIYFFKNVLAKAHKKTLTTVTISNNFKFLRVPKNFVYQEITFPKLFNISNYIITPF